MYELIKEFWTENPLLVATGITALFVTIFGRLLWDMAVPHILKFCMGIVHNHHEIKKEKTDLFKEGFASIKTSSVKLDILELGIGTGCNFAHFPKNSNLTILDRTDHFLPLLKESILEMGRGDLKISDLIVATAEDMKGIQSNSMDAVVHTFILCSIDNTTAVMNEIYRVLKPGGVAIFMEHSKDDKSKGQRILQSIVKYPLAGMDCQIKFMRPILASGKYDSLIIKESYFNFKKLLSPMHFINPVIYGYGSKKL